MQVDFDENAYLARYPDVAAAVAAGSYPSGNAHYTYCGRREGRFAPISSERKSENKKFFDDIVNGFEGWLAEYAALVTLYLLEIQAQRQVAGSLVEIGIFKGKYFSVLMREGGRSEDLIVGIDNFGFVPEATLVAILKEKMPDARYSLIAQPSNSLTGDELVARLQGRKVRFMSVDGSHECEDVVWDLMLAEDVLCAEGIVAVDDFMNIVNVGVNEGVHKFFSTPRKLVPFAFLMNKLFLCRPHMHGLYKDVIEAYIEDDTGNPHSDLFLTNRARYREAVEQELWHRKVLTVW